MTTNQTGYTIRLADLGDSGLERVGSKAANLGRLMSAGFPVPDGFVVTTAAFERFMAAGGLGDEASRQQVEAAEVPPGIAEAVLAAAEGIGDVPVAVRSSGVAEDLAGASFAGQYDTVLDVQGGEAIVSALRHCWGSAFSEHVVAYRKSQGQSAASMAVLVQVLVAADAAGVAFTANPVTGDCDEAVVSAVRGLGERLVSGEASPDEWLVTKGDAVCQRAPEDAIDAAQARAVAELARQVEAHYGAPQDIEWALADGKLHLLQARPITALAERPELPKLGKGYWLKDDGHFASLLTPFGASVYLPALETGMAAMCSEFGLPIEGVQQVSVGGEVYAQPVPVGGVKEGKPPPAWVMYLVMRLLPEMRRRRRIAEEALRSDLPGRLIERWKNEWRDQFRREAGALLDVDLAGLDDVTLLGQLDSALDLLLRGEIVHFRLMAPYVFRNYELAKTCRELLGWDTLQTLLLVSGTSETSSEPGRKLGELAAAVRNSTEARQIITEGGDDAIARLRAEAPEIAAGFDDYVSAYGHRSTEYEPGSPTLAERPELIVRLLGDRVAETNTVAADPNRISQEAISRARAELAGRPAAEVERFDAALAAARIVNPIREDNVFYTDNVPNAVIRYAVIEIGRRLADRGQLAAAEDVVLLEDAELRAAFRGERQDAAELAERRRAERVWVVAHPGPAYVGKGPGAPPTGIMPEPLRTLTESQLWFMGLMQDTPSADLTESQIGGIAGSPGSYTGRVCIIRNESEFEKLQPGDVLVCPITTPAWSVLFTQAGALVTDGGGVLAHPAIIARENGIPAILGTQEATRRLKDGQTVTVDGGSGVVEIAA